MTTDTAHTPSTFTWIELGTTDAARAKRFYADLLGWTYDDMPAGPGMTYSMAKLGDRHVAGLYEMGKEMAAAVPAHWASFVSVDDVDATAKKAAASGGKVMKEPFDVMDAGRMAVVQDPTGATISLWQAKRHRGASAKDEPGALCWNELYTTDVDAARAFYTSVLGWQTEGVDMGPMGTYTLIKVPGETKSGGGIMPMPPHMKGVPSHWLAYLQVDDCDASTKKANELGAKTLMEPMDIPNTGRFSILKDPTGAAFALYKHSH